MDVAARTLEILGDLIALPTVSRDSNLEMIAYAANLLGDCGAATEIFTSPCGTKANLFATLGPDRDGGIVLSGHSDVVPVEDQDWHTDPFVLTTTDDRLFGRGTCDMKGFIAAVLAMAPQLAGHATRRPLHVALTYDEETGCLGAQHLTQALQARDLTPGVAIIGEPTGMRVIDGHKGCNEYSTHFHGLAGHGSAPDLGVNAVEMATLYVGRLLELKAALRAMAPADSTFDPPWTTINIGAIQGGVAHNVIASKARVDWEMRPVQNGDADHVKAALARLCEDDLLPRMRAVFPDAAIELETIGEVVGLVPALENEARRIVYALTGADSSDCVAFGTEAGIFQAMGCDVVVCGPGSIDQAHKADEYLDRSQLAECLGMLDRLGAHLGG